MWKYIVVWTLNMNVIGVCPDSSITDDFGRIGSSTMKCSLLHVETVEKEFAKKFNNRKKAFKFYNKGVKEIKNDTLNIFQMGYSKVKKIKIDSTWI